MNLRVNMFWGKKPLSFFLWGSCKEVPCWAPDPINVKIRVFPLVLFHPSHVPLSPGADCSGAGGNVSSHQCPQFLSIRVWWLEIPYSSILLGSLWVYVSLFSWYSLHYTDFISFSPQLFNFAVSLLCLKWFRQLPACSDHHWLTTGICVYSLGLPVHPVFAFLQAVFYSRIAGSLIYTENLLVITIN